MNRTDVDRFEKLNAQLEGLYQEISVLAKKTPNDALNAFKIQLVNRILKNSNSFLGPQHSPFDDFELFSIDALPTNSDVTLILAQYLECAEKFRSDNIEYNPVEGGWYWKLEPAARDQIVTGPPKKISSR